jgi:hypothetical protein
VSHVHFTSTSKRLEVVYGSTLTIINEQGWSDVLLCTNWRNYFYLMGKNYIDIIKKHHTFSKIIISKHTFWLHLFCGLKARLTVVKWVQLSFSQNLTLLLRIAGQINLFINNHTKMQCNYDSAWAASGRNTSDNFLEKQKDRHFVWWSGVFFFNREVEWRVFFFLEWRTYR